MTDAERYQSIQWHESRVRAWEVARDGAAGEPYRRVCEETIAHHVQEIVEHERALTGT